jgi:hypothetical protein
MTDAAMPRIGYLIGRALVRIPDLKSDIATCPRLFFTLQAGRCSHVFGLFVRFT